MKKEILQCTGNILLQNYSEIFPRVSSRPVHVPVPTVSSWGGVRMCLEINPEETNGDLNTSYVKIAIVMTQYYITALWVPTASDIKNIPG